MKKFLGAFAAVVMLLAFAARAEAASNTFSYRKMPSSWQAELDKITTGEDGTPGVVVLVQSPEWGTRIGVSGKANLEAGEAPTPDHQFRIGSSSKTMTALVLLRLEERGLLSLDDPLTKYFDSDILPYADTITLRMCLDMSSGMLNYVDVSDIRTMQDTAPLQAWTPEEIIALVKDGTPYFAPGTMIPNPYDTYLGVPAQSARQEPMWFYVNTGYVLAGMIAEKVTGKDFDQLIKEEVFDVAGMSDTLFPTDETLPSRIARGYTRNDGNGQTVYDDWKDVTVYNPSIAWAAGAVISTPWDMRRFLEAAFTEETLISSETRQKWLTFLNAEFSYPDMDYGVGGLMQVHSPYGDCRGHGGQIYGYLSLYYYFYDQDTYFVCNLNTSDYHGLGTFIYNVMRHVTAPATTPLPKNKAYGSTLGEDGSLTLSWKDGRIYGESYAVYVGTSLDAVDTATSESAGTLGVSVFTTASRTKTLDGLSPATTYYWRVDSTAASNRSWDTSRTWNETTQMWTVDANAGVHTNGSELIGTVHGPVWSFTTGNAAAAPGVRLTTKDSVVAEGDTFGVALDVFGTLSADDLVFVAFETPEGMLFAPFFTVAPYAFTDEAGAFDVLNFDYTTDILPAGTYTFYAAVAKSDLRLVSEVSALEIEVK